MPANKRFWVRKVQLEKKQGQMFIETAKYSFSSDVVNIIIIGAKGLMHFILLQAGLPK